MGTAEMAQLPEVLKPLRKYFLRAGEMQQEGNHGVAYACKMHALQEGMKIMKEHPEAKAQCEAVVLPLFADLEKFKQAGVDVKSSTLKAGVLSAATKSFQDADAMDRASQWDRTTAGHFNSAFLLFEVMKQYGELESEVE